MSVLAENLILCQEKALDCAHQGTALTGKVRGCLTLESGLEEVAGTDTDTEGDCAVVGFSGHILIDCIGRVEATSLEEHRTERSSRTLRSDHDDIDVGWRNTACTVIPGDGETM